MGSLGKARCQRAGRGAQMAEMDAAQERGWEVEQGEERAGQQWLRTHVHTHTFSTDFQWNYYNSLQVLTDLLAECPPTASSAGLSVFHSGLEPICSLLPDSRHSEAWTHSAPSFRLLSSSLQQAEDFSLALTPARPSAHLRPSDLHLKAYFSVYSSDFPCFIFVSRDNIELLNLSVTHFVFFPCLLCFIPSNSM